MQRAAFLLFWLLNILIIYRGMDLLRRFENWAAPFVLVMTAFLLGWAVWRAHGLGYLLHEKGKYETWAQFFWSQKTQGNRPMTDEELILVACNG